MRQIHPVGAGRGTGVAADFFGNRTRVIHAAAAHGDAGAFLRQNPGNTLADPAG